MASFTPIEPTKFAGAPLPSLDTQILQQILNAINLLSGGGGGGTFISALANTSDAGLSIAEFTTEISLATLRTNMIGWFVSNPDKLIVQISYSTAAYDNVTSTIQYSAIITYKDNV